MHSQPPPGSQFGLDSVLNAPAPQLLLNLEPRASAFLGNLSTALRFSSRAAVPAGAGFRMLPGGAPGRGLWRSGFLHALAMAAVLGYARLPHSRFQLRPQATQHQAITYYRVQDELPALKTDAAPGRANVSRPAEPLPAAQEVQSLPPAPERFRQRIVVPGSIHLAAEQRLPNMMAWNPALPAPPAAGAANLGREVNMGGAASVLAPAPADLARALGKPLIMEVKVVPPSAKDAGQWNAIALPDMGAREVVAPSAPDAPAALAGRAIAQIQPAVVASAASDAPRDANSMTLAAIQPAVVAAAASDSGRGLQALSLPMQASGRPPTGAPVIGATGSSGPAAGGAGGPTSPREGSGQMIVVGLQPAEPSGAIEVPKGGLNGGFAGSPSGREGASGAPAQVAGSDGAGGAGTHTSNLSGLSIAGNVEPGPVPVVASAPHNEPAARTLTSMFAPARRSLSASMAEMRRNAGPMADVPMGAAAVFRSRRSYSMALNMANLTSVSGSWIIHFAEAELRGQQDKSELLPPAIVSKADPAYPASLMREHVEGTVTLYAIIHADGTVGSVRVLAGSDERLNQFAETALHDCRFKPAMRDGQGVELEAVFEIPFRSRPMR